MAATRLGRKTTFGTLLLCILVSNEAIVSDPDEPGFLQLRLGTSSGEPSMENLMIDATKTTSAIRIGDHISGETFMT